MSVPSVLEEPGRVDEPQGAQEYAAMLTRVVAAGRPLIVRRNGEDLAAVIPLEHLELLRDLQREHLAQQDVERLAAAIDWSRSSAVRPPQSWFDDEGDNPFEPEEDPAP
jgi:PHD/YefM family antitoxin component YafN of YafNO toxin-antitoxin module